MSQKKKAIRQAFRDACFQRDGYRCVTCGFQSTKERAEDELDAHHITNRNEMPHGGYVAENGISLCKRVGGCHEEAEACLQGELQDERFTSSALYALIGSSPEQAVDASRRLVD